MRQCLIVVKPTDFAIRPPRKDSRFYPLEVEDLEELNNSIFPHVKWKPLLLGVIKRIKVHYKTLYLVTSANKCWSSPALTKYTNRGTVELGRKAGARAGTISLPC